MAQRLAQQIVDVICDRAMAAGDMLPPEAHLMALYRVGRGTLREALRVLEAHGVVAVRPGPGGGPMVSEADAAKDLADTMKLHLQLRGATYEEIASSRVAIEPFLARLAAERRDPAGMAVLRQLNAEWDTVDLNDVEATSALAWRFHGAIGAMSGNRVVDLLGSTIMEIHRSGDRPEPGMSLQERADMVTTFHRIADAIFAGDTSEAEYQARLAMQYYARKFLPKHPEAAKAEIRWH